MWTFQNQISSKRLYLQGRILQAYKLAKCANGNTPLIKTHGQASVHSNQQRDEGVRTYKELRLFWSAVFFGYVAPEKKFKINLNEWKWNSLTSIRTI